MWAYFLCMYTIYYYKIYDIMEEMINNGLSFSGSPEYTDIFDDSKSSLNDGVVLGAVCAKELILECNTVCTSNTGATLSDLSCPKDGLICNEDCSLDSGVCSDSTPCSDSTTGTTTVGSQIARWGDFSTQYVTYSSSSQCPNWSQLKSGLRPAYTATSITSTSYANNQLVKKDDIEFKPRYGILTITYLSSWSWNISFYNPNNSEYYCVYSTSSPSFSNMTGLNSYCNTYDTGFTVSYSTVNQGSLVGVQMVANQAWKTGYYSFAVYYGNPAYFVYTYLTSSQVSILNANYGTTYSVAGSSFTFSLNG